MEKRTRSSLVQDARGKGITMVVKKHRMTGWYDPISLASIGIRVAISTVFGNFADRRELVAAINPVAATPFDPALDYSDKAKEGAFWFDFVADTGDGWSSTYAIAQLATEQTLSIGTVELPRGEVLIFGGDQVYPTASAKDYKERFRDPWDAACSNAGGQHWNPTMGDMYAIPGNHDWYDGLLAFSHLFARRTASENGYAAHGREGKVIAGRQTNQMRSYFALKLPNDWWLWGTDSQIEGFIDQPQVDFFRYVARSWMKPKSKLVLCVGMPVWTHVDKEEPEKDFNSFSFLSRIAADAKDQEGNPMEHQLKAVLTGDAHHYSRYSENGVQYITAGGGGAFLHPTNHLRKKVEFDWDFPPPNQPYQPGSNNMSKRRFELGTDGDTASTPGPKAAHSGDEALFPSRAKSRGLAMQNILFAFKNWSFMLPFILLYLMTGFSLGQQLDPESGSGLLSEVTDQGTATAADSIKHLFELAIRSVELWAAFLILCGLLVAFADGKGKRWVKLAMGAVHAVAHFAAYVVTAGLAYWAFAKCSGMGALALNGTVETVAGHALAALVAGFASATVFGLYLLVSILFKRHWNEAFSSLHIRHYKNFLRLQIDEEGLTVYPIGLRRVPSSDLKTSQLEPHLIEKPIQIR